MSGAAVSRQEEVAAERGSGGESTGARRRRRAALAAIAVGFGAVVWIMFAIVLPIAEEAECAEVEFRAGPGDAALDERDARPPLRGGGGPAGMARAALRGDTPAVFCNDFADPYVLRVDDTYYTYSTNTDEHHLPVLVSGGIFETGEYRDALAELPEWTEPGRVWSPGVLPTDDGYALFYATYVPHDRECISVAWSDDPAGPFVDESDGPMICPHGGGAIDPDPFVAADGRVFLHWKEYGPARDGIVAQELAPDARGLVGPSELVVERSEPWEGRIVEAPSMVDHDGIHYLFYSGNEWESEAYAVGYAVCESPLGPCRKPSAEPWLTSGVGAQGPGGQGIFADADGDLWMVVHAWVGGRVGYPEGARHLFVLRLDFDDGVPVAT